MKTNADIVFVEIGGTVGDLENAYFIEAMRELAYEEGPNSSCFVALTYILEPQTLGEQKSKAAQLGIKQLMQLGVQPDIIACRATNPVTDTVRQKISVYSNVPFERVISLPDSASIYTIPAMLRDRGLDFEVARLLKIEDRLNLRHERKAWAQWCDFTDKIDAAQKPVTIAITGKYTSVRDSYASIINALEHAGIALGAKVNIKWIETTNLTDANVSGHLADVDGIIVPGGFGTRGAEGKICCVKYARENNLPYLGLCFGFQMAVIEFARNVCGLTGANSTEIEPDCKEPVIDCLARAIENRRSRRKYAPRRLRYRAKTRYSRLAALRKGTHRQDAIQAPLRSRPALYRDARKSGPCFFRQSPESAHYANPRNTLASLLRRHSGPSLPDFPPIASPADVRGPRRRRDAETLPAKRLPGLCHRRAKHLLVNRFSCRAGFTPPLFNPIGLPRRRGGLPWGALRAKQSLLKSAFRNSAFSETSPSGGLKSATDTVFRFRVTSNQFNCLFVVTFFLSAWRCLSP